MVNKNNAKCRQNLNILYHNMENAESLFFFYRVELYRVLAVLSNILCGKIPSTGMRLFRQFCFDVTKGGTKFGSSYKRLNILTMFLKGKCCTLKENSTGEKRDPNLSH